MSGQRRPRVTMTPFSVLNESLGRPWGSWWGRSGRGATAAMAATAATAGRRGAVWAGSACGPPHRHTHALHCAALPPSPPQGSSSSLPPPLSHLPSPCRLLGPMPTCMFQSLTAAGSARKSAKSNDSLAGMPRALTWGGGHAAVGFGGSREGAQGGSMVQGVAWWQGAGLGAEACGTCTVTRANPDNQPRQSPWPCFLLLPLHWPTDRPAAATSGAQAAHGTLRERAPRTT